jgi:nitrate reductase gamma subunit
VTTWIEFGRGALFRVSFALMVLGLLRILILTSLGIIEAYGRNPDKIIPWKEICDKTLAWLLPIGRLWRQRPLYSVFSFFFHVGMIVTPLFLASHILLWRNSIGYGWPALPQGLANWLTLTVIVTALGLFFGRVLDARAREVSRLQDYLWPLLIATPFVTGYIASNTVIGPRTYQQMVLVHIYAGDLIMLMIPFTKIAHCVLMPLSQLVTSIAWKFPAGAGDRVIETLGFADRPTWRPKARLSTAPVATEPVMKGGIKK